MANEKELKQISKNGILVHQLPPNDKDAALSYFSEKYIQKVTCDSEGLHIFFKEYDLVVKSIKRQNIEVDGLYYKIYPKVTNLTIIGIRPFVTNDSVIENIIREYGFILDSYTVKEVTFDPQGNKTVSLSDDYRIVLDIPEVLAPHLHPVTLPNINRIFEVLFFCRLCRNNGHRQFQCRMCLTSLPSSFTSHRKETISRRMSYESQSSDLTATQNRIHRSLSHFSDDKQNSKTHRHAEMKVEKEHRSSDRRSSFEKMHQNITHKEIRRRRSYEKNPSDFNTEYKRLKRDESKNYRDRQNFEYRRDFHVKIEEEENNCSYSQMKSEKEQHFLANQNNSTRNKSHNLKYHQNNNISKSKSDDYSKDSTVNNKRQKRSKSDVYADRTSSENSDNFETGRDFRVKVEEDESYCPNFPMEYEREQKFLPNQCAKNMNHSLIYLQNRNSSERNCNDYSVNSTINGKKDKRSQSDVYVDRPRSENSDNFESYSDFHVKIEKEESNCSNSQTKSKKEQHFLSDRYSSARNMNHSLKYHQNKNYSRSKSDDYSSVYSKRNKRSQSDVYADQTSSENSDNFQEQNEEKSCVCGENNYCQKKCDKNVVSKKFLNKPTHAEEKGSCNKLEKSIVDDFMDNFIDSSFASNASFSEALVRKCSMRKNSNFDKETTTEKAPASTSNKCSETKTLASSGEGKKDFLARVLTRLLPPSADMIETKKFVKMASKCQPKDIPEEAKDSLASIVEHNRGLKKKEFCAKEIRFLKWIKIVLKEIEEAKLQLDTDKEERVSDGKSAAKTPKQRSSKKRKITLSSGIKEAISMVDYCELSPQLLCNFLNQVRGRRQWMEVACAFTQNIPGLASQLLEIVKTYYKYVQKRSTEEDRDVHYLKRLHKKLLQPTENATETSTVVNEDIREVDFETESKMSELPVKIEASAAEMSVKTEQYTAELPVQTELNMAEHAVEIGADSTKITIKQEPEILMRQSSNDGPYGASYFTNITQSPFFISIKTEKDDIE